jgi:hypothetical protein
MREPLHQFKAEDSGTLAVSIIVEGAKRSPPPFTVFLNQGETFQVWHWQRGERAADANLRSPRRGVRLSKAAIVEVTGDFNGHRRFGCGQGCDAGDVIELGVGRME